MVDKISKEQYEELCESKFWDSYDDFHRMLEEITGITAKRYTGYQYFDSYDNYVGDSNDDTVRDLLHNAYIKIESGD